MNARVTWAGEPQRCECRQMVVADLAGTLNCPLPWRYVDGTGWVHYFWGRRRRSVAAEVTP